MLSCCSFVIVVKLLIADKTTVRYSKSVSSNFIYRDVLGYNSYKLSLFTNA